jgi:hypothetical protein
MPWRYPVNNIPELLRNSFFDFFIYIFHATNPNAELIEAPFQRYICDKYQNLDHGDRLVVNQPARTGKSLTARAYALWRIGRDPTEKIVRPRYPVFVHRAAALLHAFFRPHLAVTPLRFASP